MGSVLRFPPWFIDIVEALSNRASSFGSWLIIQSSSVMLVQQALDGFSTLLSSCSTDIVRAVTNRGLTFGSSLTIYSSSVKFTIQQVLGGLGILFPSLIHCHCWNYFKYCFLIWLSFTNYSFPAMWLKSTGSWWYRTLHC